MNAKESCTWAYCPDKTLQVNSVSISDDGSRCVFGTSNEFDSGVFETYFCDENGDVLWKAPISNGKTYQGVFWTAVSGDGKFAAVGGEHSKTDGFLKAYAGADGTELLDLSFEHRVNQVSLSQDGKYLAACFGSSVAIYQLNKNENAYEELKTESLAPYNINSCEVNREGTVVVASAINYIDHNQSDSEDSYTTTKGAVYSYEISNGSVAEKITCELPTGSMRVAIVSSGNYWAASLHDGSCSLISKVDPATCVWNTKPEDLSLSLAYAVAVTETEQGEVVVACGANVHDETYKGILYLVNSKKENSEAVLKWKKPIQRSVNPGVSLDQNAKFVTATDGQPEWNSDKETPGSFYLFDVETSDEKWKYDTAIMNWPMMLAYDGESVFGGSDDGSVYYWKL